MLNEIKYIAHISVEGANEFFDALKSKVAECQSDGYSVEVQYQTEMQQNGAALFSAVVLGRE